MPFDVQDAMQEATTVARSESTSNLMEEVYSALAQGAAQNQQGFERGASAAATSAMAEFGAIELFDSGNQSAGAEQGLQNAVFNPQTDSVHFSGREQGNRGAERNSSGREEESLSRNASQSRATDSAQDRPNLGGLSVEDHGVNIDFDDKKGGQGAFNANSDGAHVEFNAPGTSVEGDLNERGLKFGAATRDGGIGVQVTDEQTSLSVGNNRGTGIAFGSNADESFLNLGFGGRELAAGTTDSGLGVKYKDSEGGEWNFDLG
jgi:hypothetical protein